MGLLADAGELTREPLTPSLSPSLSLSFSFSLSLSHTQTYFRWVSFPASSSAVDVIALVIVLVAGGLTAAGFAADKVTCVDLFSPDAAER